MLISENQALGKITSGINVSTLKLVIIDFVYSQLSEWRDCPKRPIENSEDRLNLELSGFLDSRARSKLFPIRFDHEVHQPGHQSVDMSAKPYETMVIGVKIWTMWDTILLIEGKRLPPPSKAREKEYVTGEKESSGGIQRFKLGLHGDGHDIAVIIGYLQKNSPTYWHKEINRWIVELSSGTITDNCTWSLKETLDDLVEDQKIGVAKCFSMHNKMGINIIDNITLYHLWVVMNNEGTHR